MAFVKVVVLMQLSSVLLLLSCFTTVLGDELDSVSWTHSPHPAPVYPPVEAPKPAKHHRPGHHHHPKTQPPNRAPVYPPAHSPVGYPIPPITATRKLVAVQGVVFCKSCKYIGKDTLSAASPLAGAVVRLQCNNTKNQMKVEAKSDKNGYFLIKPEKLTTYGSHKCKVFLISSPLASCNKPTDLHAGYKGAILMPTAETPIPIEGPLPPPTSSFELFTVGPFAFDPVKAC